MPKKWKYWKTTIAATLLTAGVGPPEYGSVSAAGRDMEEGDASGVFSDQSVEITEDQMRELLLDHGSDPDFLISENEEEEGESTDAI